MQFSIGTVPWRFESKAAIAAHWSQAMLDQGGHAIHEANCHGWGEDFKLWAHKAFWEVTGFEAWQIIVEDGRRRIWELPNEWHQVGEEHVAASIVFVLQRSHKVDHLDQWLPQSSICGAGLAASFGMKQNGCNRCSKIAISTAVGLASIRSGLEGICYNFDIFRTGVRSGEALDQILRDKWRRVVVVNQVVQQALHFRMHILLSRIVQCDEEWWISKFETAISHNNQHFLVLVESTLMLKDGLRIAHVTICFHRA
mmetsp:Transcript_6104/g.13853  ORF Transcript_6104/g.13853 Transcript_6104/m.13853 type:complete len:255 (-) Transcript_6104:1184-1948(-)